MLLINLLILSLFGSVHAVAGPSYKITYQATCKGAGFDLQPVTIQWDGSFDVINGKLPKEAGPNFFKVVRNSDGIVQFDLESAKQKLFRETAAGVSFFGIYDDVHFTAPSQRVYVFIRYGSISSVFWYLSSAVNRPEHQDLFLKELNSLTFDFQAIAEDDSNGALSLRFQCAFTPKKS